MKIIKLLLIGILVVATSNIVAQEKQNDATWEETISFLKDNITNLNVNMFYKGVTSSGKSSYSYMINSSDEFVTKQGDHTYTVKLIELLHPKIYTNSDGQISGFRLYFNSGMVLFQYDGGSSRKSNLVLNLHKSVEYGEDNIWKSGTLIFNKNSELPKRIYKAFQHLAYLAKEKRKESKF